MNNKKIILLVEDEIIIAISEKSQLEKYGYEVIIAYSGENAIDTLKTNDIDLILMDIDLGKGINGPDTAGIILLDNDIPIVFLSSHSEKEIVEKTEQITSYGYVVKNSGITVLDASIKMAFKLFESKQKEKIAHSALQESETRYDKLAEQSRIVIWEVDSEGLYTYMSHVSIPVFGLNPDELIDKKYFYDLHPEDGRETFKTSTIDIFNKKLSFVNLENPVQHADGNIVWVSTTAMPILNTDGSLRGYRGSDTDITEHKILKGIFY